MFLLVFILSFNNILYVSIPHLPWMCIVFVCAVIHKTKNQCMTSPSPIKINRQHLRSFHSIHLFFACGVSVIYHRTTHTHNPNRVQVQFIFKPTMMIKIHILCLYLGEMRIPLLLFAKEQDTNKKNQIGLTPKKKQNMYLSLMIVPPETCHILD